MSRYYLYALKRCHCGKPATHEVRNEVNASMGSFCEPHAKAKIKQLENPKGMER